MLHEKILQFAIQKIRHLIYLVWANLPPRVVKPNLSVSIDVIIPIIEKDLALLPLCLEGLKKNVDHEIKDIYIVAPANILIKEFAQMHDLVFIDENTVLGYSPGNIDYTIATGLYAGLNRSGWIFQQLLKLSGRIGTSRYFLVIDADHILLKPHVFIAANNSLVFYQSSECHIAYYKNIHKLLKFYPTSLFSYVSHKMIFDKEALKELHLKIESSANSKLKWDEVILSHLDINEVSCFSEFELYGNYVARKKKILLPWRQKALNKKLLTNYSDLQRLNAKYSSVTFPYHLNK